MSSGPGLMLAAALFHGEVSEADRVQKLSGFFSPPPGTLISLSYHDRIDFGRKVDPATMRGQIQINPPPGGCLTIRRSDQSLEDHVCKPTQLSFVLDDLDSFGRLHWQVLTGEGDFGTELLWPSKYRAALVTAAGNDKAPIERRYIDSCTPVVDNTGRSIRLRLLSGETWVIRFPHTDFMPTQPRAVANLDAIVTVGKIGVGDAAEAKKADEANAKADAKADAEAQGADTASAHAEDIQGNRDAGVPPEKDDRKEWAIPYRASYVMNSDAFQPNGSVPHGIYKGRCRYNFYGPVEDRATGRMECHETDGYQMVYLPLTCLREIGPKR